MSIFEKRASLKEAKEEMAASSFEEHYFESSNLDPDCEDDWDWEDSRDEYCE